ncbi:MAG: 3-oxoacyl-[acyl-carrier-protein] reductase [Candidatus Saelkia tenebricola]|nr:3-oxoacyl-[acyl-carrier-protein] reductase [Candidatus Saelkia tenebricola]
MDMLKGKVAVITGAARGIGREIALTFARNGAGVACIDLDLGGIKEVAEEIKVIGGKSSSFKCDISNSGEVEEVFASILQEFPQIDILINNAGITKDNLLIRMSEDEWDSVLRVNLKGAFNCTKVISKHMIKKRQGKIINIASIIGLIGNAGQVNYAASKGGLIAFTKSVAKELASRNVNVNAIAPGFIRTKMTDSLIDEVKNEMLKRIPLAKFGNPSDVANTAIFLASTLSDYITGQVITVDGGMVM